MRSRSFWGTLPIRAPPPGTCRLDKTSPSWLLASRRLRLSSHGLAASFGLLPGTAPLISSQIARGPGDSMFILHVEGRPGRQNSRRFPNTLLRSRRAESSTAAPIESSVHARFGQTQPGAIPFSTSALSFRGGPRNDGRGFGGCAAPRCPVGTPVSSCQARSLQQILAQSRLPCLLAEGPSGLVWKQICGPWCRSVR